MRRRCARWRPPPGDSSIASAPPPPRRPRRRHLRSAERARLNGLVANIDGAQKTIDLAEVRVRELIKTITELRQSLFTRNLFARAQSPLLPHHWQRAARDVPATIGFGQYVAADWFREAVRSSAGLAMVLLAALAAWIVLGFAMRWLERVNDSPPPGGRSFIQRAQKIAWIAPARALPIITAIAIIYVGLHSLAHGRTRRTDRSHCRRLFCSQPSSRR